MNFLSLSPESNTECKVIATSTVTDNYEASVRPGYGLVRWDSTQLPSYSNPRPTVDQ